MLLVVETQLIGDEVPFSLNEDFALSVLNKNRNQWESDDREITVNQKT